MTIESFSRPAEMDSPACRSGGRRVDSRWITMPSQINLSPSGLLVKTAFGYSRTLALRRQIPDSGADIFFESSSRVAISNRNRPWHVSEERNVHGWTMLDWMKYVYVPRYSERAVGRAGSTWWKESGERPLRNCGPPLLSTDRENEAYGRAVKVLSAEIVKNKRRSREWSNSDGQQRRQQGEAAESDEAQRGIQAQQTETCLGAECG